MVSRIRSLMLIPFLCTRRVKLSSVLSTRRVSVALLGIWYRRVVFVGSLAGDEDGEISVDSLMCSQTLRADRKISF